MGLDMFASTRKTMPLTPINFDTSEEELADADLFYWRKHPNLHGWMQRLYVEKGGSSDPDEFNCVSVVLTAADLDRLEADVKGNNLPETRGFFFGQSTPEDRPRDLKFIAKARAAIERGEIVFYHSRW